MSSDGPHVWWQFTTPTRERVWSLLTRMFAAEEAWPFPAEASLAWFLLAHDSCHLGSSLPPQHLARLGASYLFLRSLLCLGFMLISSVTCPGVNLTVPDSAAVEDASPSSRSLSHLDSPMAVSDLLHLGASLLLHALLAQALLTTRASVSAWSTFTQAEPH